MPNMKKTLWGRTLELSVEKARCTRKEYLLVQDEALKRIIKQWDVVESCLGNLEEYCIKKNGDAIGTSIDNIFRYVIPKTLYIPRCRFGRTCAILCDYKFDPEHGLALVFKDEQLVDIGPGDIVS